MLTLMDGRRGFSRRAFLRVGSLALGGIALPQLLAAKAATEPMTIARLNATILHTLFDVGQLRITQGIPRDVLNVVTAAEPIPGLTL